MSCTQAVQEHLLQSVMDGLYCLMAQLQCAHHCPVLLIVISGASSGFYVGQHGEREGEREKGVKRRVRERGVKFSFFKATNYMKLGLCLWTHKSNMRKKDL